MFNSGSFQKSQQRNQIQENKTTLEITIESVEFAQEYNYFLTIQLDGDGEKVNQIN